MKSLFLVIRQNTILIAPQGVDCTFYTFFNILTGPIVFFTKLNLKLLFEYDNTYKFQFMRSLFEGNLIQTLLIQP